MTEKRILAWHFICSNRTTEYGNIQVRVGETITHDGEIQMCKSGLHASVDIMDALDYATDTMLCRVEIWGDVQEHEDKLVARNRKALWMKNIASDLQGLAISRNKRFRGWSGKDIELTMARRACWEEQEAAEEAAVGEGRNRLKNEQRADLLERIGVEK